jgi:signal transduction histidine kinase
MSFGYYRLSLGYFYLFTRDRLSRTYFLLQRTTNIQIPLVAITVTITTTEGTDSSGRREAAITTNTVVSIMDTGEGIDPQIYPRLFTKFATKSHIGTELGLFISKNIVEAHRGKIWAQNNSSGKGATFSFSLPSTTT